MKTKLVLYLFSAVLFVAMGVRHTFTNPDNYINQTKNSAELIFYTIDQIACHPHSKASDVLTIGVKENGAVLTGYIDGKFDCNMALDQIKRGQHASSHINRTTNQLMSLQVDGKWLMKFETYLDEKRHNYNNYSVIYFVIALVMTMAFIVERRKLPT